MRNILISLPVSRSLSNVFSNDYENMRYKAISAEEA